MTPRRIQRKRTKGWKMPENTVYVGRPTKWGNPFLTERRSAFECVELFKKTLSAKDSTDLGTKIFGDKPRDNTLGDLIFIEGLYRIGRGICGDIHELRGKNLACWCRLCEAHKDGKPRGVHCKDCAPCHVDPLLEIANGNTTAQ
jgi:hypothetical protein